MIPGNIISTLLGQISGVVAALKDSYFKYTALLINADATSTATNNNTFVDSSANNLTITRNGTATQGTFSPFSNAGWSGLFNGTSNYLSIPDNVALQPGTGDFTMECWVYRTSTVTTQAAIYQGAGGTNYQLRWGLLWNGTTWVYRLSNTGSSGDIANDVSMGTDPGIGKWVHLALVRNGNTFTPYINGVPGTTTTSSLALQGTGSPVLTIGNALTSLYFFGGYISNVRIVKGTALYTEAFTPSTTPLTAVSGTSLLTLQNNRVKDNSTVASTITTVGMTIQATSPFVPPAPWSAVSNGGSIYFNGSTDFLTTSAVNTGFAFGTGDFTVETWVYPTVSANSMLVSNNYNFSTGQGNWGFYTTVGASNLMYFNSISGNRVSTVAALVPLNQWSHVAYSRQSGTGRFFVNGSQIGTGVADTINYASSTGTMYIGDKLGAGAKLTGYMSGVKITKGTALYTASFSIPTEPATSISSTSLLLNGANSAIADASGKTDIVTNGSVATTTAVKKYGTSSVSFNGSTDYLALPLVQTMQLGPADFTCESWVYLNSIGARQTIAFINGNASGFAALAFNILANGKLSCAMSETGSTWKFEDITGLGTALSTNTWYHVAVVRNGATITVYLNGSSIGTYSLTAATTSLMTTYTLNQIGVYNTSNYRMNGYIDDLRITRGHARYTANFTPPTEALPVE